MADLETTDLAQQLWRHLEPIHATVYFAPEHRSACDRLGLRGGWMAYFASRAAPLGAASAELVAAAFYNFHPSMIARALPDAWSYADPAAVLQARYEAVGQALRRLIEPWIEHDSLAMAATLAAAAVSNLDASGRALFAANSCLPWPDEAHLVLWHAATLSREHRGDGHNAVLLAEGIDGCQAHVLQVAAGAVPRATLQTNRGFSDSDWQTAATGLQQRGLLDRGGALTRCGRELRAHVDQRTDELATEPVTTLGPERAHALLEAVAPITRQVLDTGLIPFPNPMGIPAPSGQRAVAE